MKIKTIADQTEFTEKMKQFVHSKLTNIFLKENGHQDCNKILFINPPDGDHDMFNYTSAKSGRCQVLDLPLTVFDLFSSSSFTKSGTSAVSRMFQARVFIRRSNSS